MRRGGSVLLCSHGQGVLPLERDLLLVGTCHGAARQLHCVPASQLVQRRCQFTPALSVAHPAVEGAGGGAPSPSTAAAGAAGSAVASAGRVPASRHVPPPARGGTRAATAFELTYNRAGKPPFPHTAVQLLSTPPQTWRTNWARTRHHLYHPARRFLPPNRQRRYRRLLPASTWRWRLRQATRTARPYWYCPATQCLLGQRRPHQRVTQQRLQAQGRARRVLVSSPRPL